MNIKKVLDITLCLSLIIICLCVSLSSYYVPNLKKFLKHEQLRIAITSLPTYEGEKRSCMRICNTLQKMGYNSFTVITVFKPFLFNIFDVDLVINLRPEVGIEDSCFNYLIYHLPYDKNNRFCKEMRKCKGILSLIPEADLRKNTGYTGPVILFYLTEHATEFFDAPKQRLFYCGALWDKFRTKTCLKLYRLLDKTEYVDIYGPTRHWEPLHLKSYKGYIKNENESLLNTMKKAGVSLILHSDDHFKHNITTARIFESLAASNVIISDRLPFIVKNFGDSVLYIDRDLPPEKMFEQIDNHMKWIISHQKEAIELARKAHAIFIKKYTLEKILENVINEYYKIKRKKSGNFNKNNLPE